MVSSQCRQCVCCVRDIRSARPPCEPDLRLSFRVNQDERREGGKKIRYLSAPDVVVADSSKVFLQDEVDEKHITGSVVGQQKNTQETYRGTTRKMPNAYDS